MAERALGRPDAPVVVQEWFSLTCTHCAHFALTAFPEVKRTLIDTGRVRYVFRDFPLDRLALAAAMVARTLPPDRYAPFVDTLFATQDRWAFVRDADPIDRLRHEAALAGMDDASFRRALDDQALQDAILREQTEGDGRFKIEGTPTFVFNDAKRGPIITAADFLKAVDDSVHDGPPAGKG
ncbi:DsbA family protein [Rhizosaccharibacter radicis]|uniref:DsbA family protein n=1 Tax=Rhizosaccharibacter radicis TaxID=2782605 RepID=A0ABT1VUK6_9PROT|nr:DsbA family protein [Acetobacteraceae bacterium KSS12]